MKGRVISFFEVENAIMELSIELEISPLDVDSIIEKGRVVPFMLHLCISQMQSFNSKNYPDKDKHYEILNEASKAIKYKTNTGTFDEIRSQINEASKAFGQQ